MKQQMTVLLFTCFYFTISVTAVGQELILLPQPQSIILSDGFFKNDLDQLTISYPTFKAEETNARTQLKNIFTERSVKWTRNGKADMVFKLVDQQDTDVPNHLEGYWIRIEGREITVKARSESGLFYAVQTLKQLFNQQVNGKIPECTISDFPTLKNRGLMDDISRGPLPSLEFAKAQIRRLSSLKYNIFTFYIEHVVKTKQHGSFAPKEGLTITEIEELAAYAKLHNIQLVGSFQSLGHFNKILEFSQYRHLGSTSRMLKPGDSTSLKFMKEVIGELAPAFSGSFFNLNGDEAWDLARAAKMHPEGLSSGQLYLRHMQPLLEDLIARGIRPMMWGDILKTHPEIISKLPKETIVLTWDYSDRDSFSNWIDPFRDSGLDYWVCPGVLNSNRFYPDFDESLGNIFGFVGEGLENNTSGMLLTVWDDGGRHFFSRDWLGVAFGAEQSWNYSPDHKSSFIHRFSNIFYSDSNGVFETFMDKMHELKSSPVMLNMNNESFIKDVFPSRDQELSFSRDNWSKVQKTVVEAQVILNRLNASVYPRSGDLQFWYFTLDQLELLAFSRIKMIELSKVYKGASFIQLMDSDSTKQQLKVIATSLKDLEVQWQRLFDEFQRLWLIENRTYWVKEANEPFKRHLMALGNVREALEHVIATFNPDNGIYLPAPGKVGFTIADITSAYFNYWLVTGPFKITDYEQDTQVDFLEAMGGEESARPISGTLFESPDGRQMMWDKIASTYDDRLVLAELFQDKTKAVAYAYCQIKSPDAMEVTASFGSNDGIAVLLNGQEVFREHTKRNMIKGENSVQLSLQEGTNHVLVKSDQWKGKWEFSFMLDGVKWTSHKHKYTLTP
ncbi:MAG: glycoside hydrolase family 20 zincin-like fold domain-containing protein [Bacteroidota bacterium]